ncbi:MULTISPECIES: tyrosine phosphatase family protein [unclassified Ochrobactrum]|uniref:tyrosine phosphatase family protein n=1 Tax=unclassified Ochrobactrum TaxID=239106 RepID=UPI000DEF5AD8|nr:MULTISPECIES: tyrosine phosphatase family protein [unclassified Ochrobactrum]MBQ0709749.1 tyrosine phosphatase family protein [Ochrobactrum sp. AP1BH01-1]
MSQIVVTPLSQLAAQLALHRPSHVVTLGSEAPAPLPDGCGATRLSLTFNDIVEPREGLIAPDESHVQQLLDFAKGWPMAAPLLIHCYAGISRSTAAAYIIASALNPTLDESELARIVRSLSPSATPNIRLVALADEILNRQGRMVAAIRAIGRGADAFEGEVFSLPARD